MTDIIVLFVFAVVAPLVLLAVLTWVFMFIRARWTGARPNYRRVLTALGVALLTGLLFPVVFGFTIGVLFGGALGYGFLAVVLMATMVVTLFCFVYVARRGPRRPQSQ